MANALADQLEQLAERVGRLCPSRRDPEGFFEERDEVRGAIVRLAREHRREQLA